MLFNSYLFIFVFLPVTLAIYFLARKYGSLKLALCGVVLASIVYYAYWKIDYLAILLGSVAVNYVAGSIIIARATPNWAGPFANRVLSERSAWWITATGIAFNLGLLGYYKYAGFFAYNINATFGDILIVPQILLPIGISFFTFQQIAFLADAYKNVVRDKSFINYGFFVTFFPQLIAGPIVHHSEVMPQLNKLHERDRRTDIAVGLAIFTVGLFKKVVIADSLAVYADAGYGSLSDGTTLSLASAWVTVLAYSFQLYFDFSGYSDMAVGLARMFGVVLPVNFYSPYKATGIADFWRRWHITLSRFLRDYLYIPLGGNRQGLLRQTFNLTMVMFLGGLWHGAAWTFVVWGLVHGAMLAINHLWSLTSLSKHWLLHTAAGRGTCIAVTFLAATLAWVPFRAADLQQAWQMLTLLVPSDTEQNSVWSLVEFAKVHFGSLGAWLNVTLWAPEPELWPQSLPANYIAEARPAGITLLAAAVIAFWAPNTYQLFAKFDPALGLEAMPDNQKGALSGLQVRHAVVLGALLALSLLAMQRVSPFLYFQF